MNCMEGFCRFRNIFPTHRVVLYYGRCACVRPVNYDVLKTAIHVVAALIDYCNNRWRRFGLSDARQVSLVTIATDEMTRPVAAGALCGDDKWMTSGDKKCHEKCLRFVHTGCGALRCVAVSCGMRQKNVACRTILQRNATHPV